jgi:shikimate dehydrogenase
MSSITPFPLPLSIVKGTTRLIGLLGHHIGHTLSPLIHNASAAQLGKDAVYVPFDVAEGQILNLLSALWQCDALGFNVTTPYKTVLARLLSGHGLTSVNTIYRGKSGWMAASTDGPGFDRAAASLGRPVHEWQRVVILGAGGAISGILAHWDATKTPIREVVILRREAAPEQQLKMAAPRLKMSFMEMTPQHFHKAIRDSESLIIQGTNAPFKGDTLAPFASALENTKSAVSDLCYGKVSALVPKARELGLPCQDGLPMLIEQARLSQEFWWGASASSEFILEAIQTFMKAAVKTDA